MKPVDTFNPYHAMAVVYDALIEDVDYVTWANEWQKTLEALAARKQRIAFSGMSLLEIGAGTGNMTEVLVKTGMRITAIDPSEAMLSILQEKLFQNMGKIRLFNGLLEDFHTKETFDIAAGFLDVLNYVAPTDLPRFFQTLALRLKPSGLATFDISTPYKLEHTLGQHTFAENHDEFAFIWENHYNAKRKWLDFDFALFSETEEGLFERHVERHRQYAHSIKTIVRAASSAGFELKCILNDAFERVDDHTKNQLEGDLEKPSSRWHFYFENKAVKESI